MLQKLVICGSLKFEKKVILNIDKIKDIIVIKNVLSNMFFVFFLIRLLKSFQFIVVIIVIIFLLKFVNFKFIKLFFVIKRIVFVNLINIELIL